ncbi:MAG TPA: four helix bundle protein [Thermoanaerobaculia bacterium]|nr:four helix bundle protein [Thermoanaerobaculia bacterium]
MTRSTFKNLTAWRAARRLVRAVYQFTDRFPDCERYVLVSQMRRAVHSVHSNIAEGSGRLSQGEWQHFLGQCRGSLMELESDTIAAFDLGYCQQDEAAALTEQLKRVAQLINGLLRSTKRKFPAKKYSVNG